MLSNQVLGNAVAIEPEVVLPGDVATAGDLSAAYVGVLVSVKDVVVESITPDPAGQSLPARAVIGGDPDRCKVYEELTRARCVRCCAVW